MGFVWRTRGSKLGEQTVGSEWERPWTVFMGFGEHELGKMGAAWLIAGQSKCP
jgi:hypothetical protein